MLVIGSTALAHYSCGGFRTPVDLDLMGTEEEARAFYKAKGYESVQRKGDKKVILRGGGNPITEIELATPDSIVEVICNYAKEFWKERTPEGFILPPLDFLYTLKMSHRFLKNSPHFAKTMEDIWVMRGLGATIPESLKDWYGKRVKETYTYPHPKLNQSKEGFFDPKQVPYTYDHDSIHLAVAFDPLTPAYSKFKDAEVKVSRTMFEALPDEVKLHSVVEESFVLALERSQIPFRGKVTPEASFKKALEKVCTSISSGWWRDWAWEHYYQALDLGLQTDYLALFDKGLEQGVIKPFEVLTHGN